MNTTARRLLLWTPRILGILVSVFIGLFALDAFSHSRSFFEALPDFLVHLIPAVVLLAFVAMSWRREWIGGLTFIGCAVAYALTTASGRPDWMLVMSGPLVVVGALYLWSWRRQRELPSV